MEFVFVCVQQDDGGQLQNEQNQEENCIGHCHANRFTNCATASQERDEHNNRANCYQNNWQQSLRRETDLAVHLDGTNALQDNHAIGNARNADNLQKSNINLLVSY